MENHLSPEMGDQSGSHGEIMSQNKKKSNMLMPKEKKTNLYSQTLIHIFGKKNLTT